ncbi:MAG: YSC84-related protein [Xanthomonadales bacterium]|jgi:lipid-binding SYLF domain-containing protein|nr:YSC84-related protein [Xanthomonadales bacterium]
MRKQALFFIAVFSFVFTSTLWAFNPDVSDELQLDVAKAIIDIKKADPGIEEFFNNAAGYAVIPKVGKGGVGIGGAYGKGLVIVGDEAVGRTTLSQVTVGFQLGGQVYSQFIFFKDQAALEGFQRGNFEMGAQASAVAVTLGASADADYDKGVAVFTHVSGGLMYEATISGQKFKYEAL